jgi:hypothetical protein
MRNQLFPPRSQFFIRFLVLLDGMLVGFSKFQFFLVRNRVLLGFFWFCLIMFSQRSNFDSFFMNIRAHVQPERTKPRTRVLLMRMTHCSGETSPGEDGAEDEGVTNEDDSLFWRNLSRQGRSRGRGCY